MRSFANEDGTWTETSSVPDIGISIQVEASDTTVPPDIRLLADGTPFFHVAGVDPRPRTDTTHTVAHVAPDAPTGNAVFAVHADDNDLVFEDRRAGSESAVDEEALDHVQSALNEILIPVYIDDVVSDLSERVAGLVLLHTVQYEDSGPAWSYFRTSMFSDGELCLEDEYGEM